MKETKRTFPYFKFYNRNGIKAYLEKMAEKGWLLTRAAEFGWHFRRIEPQKLHFSVIYFPQESLFTPGMSENLNRFHEFCAHTGWKPASANAQVQIFYNEAEDPVPIETDAVLEAENIHKAVKKRFLPQYFIELFLALYNIIFFAIHHSKSPIPFLASNADLLFFLCWIIVGVLSLGEIVGYFSWYHKAKKRAASENCFSEPKGTPEHLLFIVPLLLFGLSVFVADKVEQTIAVPAVLAVIGALLFIAFSAVFVFLGLLGWLKKKNVPAGLNRTITFLGVGVVTFLSFLLMSNILSTLLNNFPSRSNETAIAYEYNGHTFYAYQDELPFTVSHLMKTDYTEYSRRCSTKESFLLSYLEASEHPRYNALAEPDLEYRIVKIKVPFLYNICLNAMLKDFSHNYGTPEPEDPNWEKHVIADATPWGATKAYLLSLGEEPQNRYLLCYDDAIVEIDSGWAINREQMQKAGEIFKLYLNNSK